MGTRTDPEDHLACRPNLLPTREKRTHAALLGVFVLPIASSLLAPSSARAYGALFSSVEAPATREHATVVAFRESGLTALTMQSDYRGPSADLALVVPVPASTTLADVRVLDAAAVASLERSTAPRLVELWERDPCADGDAPAHPRTSRTASDPGPVAHADESGRVGDYEVTLLDATSSAHLDTWLAEHGMRVPENTAELARPHVAAHARFLVARLPRERVAFEDGRAVLPPLRVDLETPEVSLPLSFCRAGLGAAASTVVLTVGRHRYEPVNVRNVFGLTNLDVDSAARDRLGPLHEALGGGLFARDANILLTTHAERVTDCSACADLSFPEASTLGALGADVLFEGGLATGLGHGGGERMTTSITQELTIPRTEGPIDAEVAARVMRRYVAMLRACYELELAGRPIDRATQRMELAVAPDGTIARTTTAATRAGLMTEPALDCLRDRAARTRFPAREAGSSVVLSMSWRGRDPNIEAHEGRPMARAGDLVLTRFEQRGGLPIDPVLVAAPPVVGGREVRDPLGALEGGAHADSSNAFETRYVIRHPWRGPIACESPRRDVWLAREHDDGDDTPATLVPTPLEARASAEAPLALAELVRTAVPELGLRARNEADEPAPSEPASSGPAADEPTATSAPATSPAEATSSGWCSARPGRNTPGPLASLAFALALVALAHRRSTRR